MVIKVHIKIISYQTRFRHSTTSEHGVEQLITRTLNFKERILNHIEDNDGQIRRRIIASDNIRYTAWRALRDQQSYLCRVQRDKGLYEVDFAPRAILASLSPPQRRHDKDVSMQSLVLYAGGHIRRQSPSGNDLVSNVSDFWSFIHITLIDYVGATWLKLPTTILSFDASSPVVTGTGPTRLALGEVASHTRTLGHNVHTHTHQRGRVTVHQVRRVTRVHRVGTTPLTLVVLIKALVYSYHRYVDADILLDLKG
uniref:Uncharacterized protein n=1 Tax=Timema poppense TaxID=170557 RepID=A0A7R9H746_TIMPO|nr:unnamed protein product [Timema poppensis]